MSILIKALNEEKNIAEAIESAIAALDGMSGEIILADSLSTDSTVEVAKKYPIRIVTLARAADRSCGIGAQLGYQYSLGDYVCLIDGDQRLYRGFLAAAIERLEADQTLAGVGGVIVEREEDNLEYIKRATRDDPDRRPGYVTRLDCGGIYRRTAIESIGFFTDRNLHSGEEFDLGSRLSAQGWKLARIDQLAIDHFGHRGSAYALLVQRVRSRMAFGAGETLRAALGKPHFAVVMRHQWKLFALWTGVHLWWASLVVTPFLVANLAELAAVLAALILLPLALMILKCRSLSLGLYSVVAWNAYALCFIPGLLRRRTDPARRIDSQEVGEVAEAFPDSGIAPAGRGRAAIPGRQQA
ncbi:MAG: glycosyltransferase [Alphaproteobacteria bacterium]